MELQSFDSGEIQIPLPPSVNRRLHVQRPMIAASSSVSFPSSPGRFHHDRTPLLPHKRNKRSSQKSLWDRHSLSLCGHDGTNRKAPQESQSSTKMDAATTTNSGVNREAETATSYRRRDALGFIGISLSLLATTSASVAPVALLPCGFEETSDRVPDETTWAMKQTQFASHVTTVSVLGTALGKLANGPLVDMLSPKVVSIGASISLALVLQILAFTTEETGLLRLCFLLELLQSVQWPCCVVMIASYGQGTSCDERMFFASLALRVGALLSLWFTPTLLVWTGWRSVACWSAAVATFGAVVCFLLCDDGGSIIEETDSTGLKGSLGVRDGTKQLVRSGFVRQFFSCMSAVLRSGIFWIVATAHAGDTMVRSSDRILRTYVNDTFGDSVFSGRFGALLATGTVSGLVVTGFRFVRQNDKDKKRTLRGLYGLAIAACYVLALLSLPVSRTVIGPASVLVCQAFSVFVMGFGTAVQGYIPGLIGAHFGHAKGTFVAYVDGVAYAVSAMVWHVVGCVVDGGQGWAYGWAAIALLLLVCAFLMLEFMEHQFVRTRWGAQGRQFETLLFV